MKRLLLVPIFLCLVGIGQWVHAEFDVLDVMYDELQRSYEKLQSEDEPPFYISYEITQDVTMSVSGSYGAVNSAVNQENRVLDIDIRVGAPELDNTHFGGGLATGNSGISINSADSLRNSLWFATNSGYRNVLTQLSNVRAAMQNRVEEDDQSGDFSSAPAEEFRADIHNLDDEKEAMKAKVARYGAPFKYADHIISNSVSIVGDVETRWFVNSEGTKVLLSEPYYRIVVSASSKAEDGMVLPRVKTYSSSTFEGLPSDEEIIADVEYIIENLAEMREAPLVDPYEGPAILSGRASGVFFHEILGHRLEGHRQKAEHEGQTFKAKLGQQVLPENFSVIFDPNVRTFGDIELIGSYYFDNQGVRGQRVTVIENGILKGFLTSRLPLEGFLDSNGHGRKNAGLAVVPRQSNMFIDVQNPVTPEELQEMLLARVEEQGKDFGLYFDDITGGFAITQRSMPNAFNVTPVLVYKLYKDGRKEMVRGVNLIGTPLTTFSRIEQGATDYDVFNGICGAESGQVPVAAISPSILVSQIEVQKMQSSRGKPPILPNPVTDRDDLSMHTGHDH